MRLQTNGMTERFNGRIEDVLQRHRFRNGEDLEQAILRYVQLYNSQLPQAVLKGRTSIDELKTGIARNQGSLKRDRTITRDVTGTEPKVRTAFVGSTVLQKGGATPSARSAAADVRQGRHDFAQTPGQIVPGW